MAVDTYNPALAKETQEYTNFSAPQSSSEPQTGLSTILLQVPEASISQPLLKLRGKIGHTLFADALNQQDVINNEQLAGIRKGDLGIFVVPTDLSGSTPESTPDGPATELVILTDKSVPHAIRQQRDRNPLLFVDSLKSKGIIDSKTFAGIKRGEKGVVIYPAHLVEIPEEEILDSQPISALEKNALEYRKAVAQNQYDEHHKSRDGSVDHSYYPDMPTLSRRGNDALTGKGTTITRQRQTVGGFNPTRVQMEDSIETKIRALEYGLDAGIPDDAAVWEKEEYAEDFLAQERIAS